MFDFSIVWLTTPISRSRRMAIMIADLPLGNASDYASVEAQALSVIVYAMLGSRSSSNSSNSSSSVGQSLIETTVQNYADRYYTLTLFTDTSNRVQINQNWDSIALGVDYSKDDAVIHFMNFAPNTTRAILYNGPDDTDVVFDWTGYVEASAFAVVEIDSKTDFRVTVDGVNAPLTMMNFDALSPRASYTVYVYTDTDGSYVSTIQFDRAYNSAFILRANLLLAVVLIATFVYY